MELLLIAFFILLAWVTWMGVSSWFVVDDDDDYTNWK